MTEQAIFLAALEQDDATARADYLDNACAGDLALRERIEALLTSHAQSGSFLDATLIDQAAAADQSLSFLQPPTIPGSLGRLDHYDVLDVLGRGGMGVVLKARDSKLNRIVALKVLARHLAVSPTARRQFVHEAQAAAAIRDEHVVTIYAVSDEGPRPYLAMEYIAGATLEERLEPGAPLPLQETVRIGAQVATGLAAAHVQGLVHRDVKPGNILLEDGTGRVKITDFGLAETIGTALAGGVIAGTPMFMSPEQARGAAIDQRSDLFSLGSVLYVLCTGRPPFAPGDTAAVLARVAADTPLPAREVNPRVPDWLSDLITQLHAKEPSARIASARAVRDHLADCVTSVRRRPNRRWRRPLVVAAVAAILIAGGLLAVYFGRDYITAPAGSAGAPVSLELHREDIPPNLLALAGGGDPAHAPRELVAVLGNGRFLLPRAGSMSFLEQSADGKVLAVPLDEDVVLFATSTGEYLRSFKGPGGRVLGVAFTGDKRLLAATTWKENAAGAGAVRVWDLQVNQELCTIEVLKRDGSSAVVFSPDGQCLLATGSNRLYVWEARTGKVLQTVHQKGGLAGMSFSPSGRRLAGADFRGKCVKVFDWDGAHLTEVRSLVGHTAPVVAVAYSPDGKYLASGDEQRFKLWNAQTLVQVGAVDTPAWQLFFAPDGRTLLASMTTDRLRTVHTFTRWAVDGSSHSPALSVNVSAIPDCAFPRLGRDGKDLFLGRRGITTYVQVIDMETGKERFPHPGHDGPLRTVAVSPNGSVVASAGEDQVIKLWDLATRQVIRALKRHAATVCGLSFGPDGRQLVSASVDGAIVFWDVSAGTEIRTLRGDADAVARIQFSPDGALVASGGQGGLVKVWHTATGQARYPLPGHTGVVRCVAFSPDGQWLASGGEDRTVLLHPLAEGRSHTFRAPTAVNAVAFSPDGRMVAAVGDAHVPRGVFQPDPEATLHLWDLETGKETTLAGHTGDIHGLAFSPMAPVLATSAADGTIRLWDYSTGARLVQIIGPGPFGGPVASIAFTPDGRYLITANHNGMAHVLAVTPP
jgi:WD40 repeat protein/tRNA A-37 threonylcarbamoyl transferase component Bud32